MFSLEEEYALTSELNKMEGVTYKLTPAPDVFFAGIGAGVRSCDGNHTASCEVTVSSCFVARILKEGETMYHNLFRITLPPARRQPASNPLQL